MGRPANPRTAVTGITVNPRLSAYSLHEFSFTGEEGDESQHTTIQNDSRSNRPDRVGLSGAALCASDGPHVRLDAGAGACHRPSGVRIPEWRTFPAQCEYRGGCGA